MWLPECAYRPTWEHWVPSVLYDEPRVRIGLEHFIAAAGVNHFFVDAHLVTGAQPLAILEDGKKIRTVSEAQLHWDRKRGWANPLQPVGVASTPSRRTALRSPATRG